MSTSIASPAAPTSSSTLSKPPAWVCAVAEQPTTAWLTSGVLLAAVPFCVKRAAGFPHLVQLPLFAAIFGGSGYMIQAGDPINGSGTTTAWSLTYLFLHGKKALVSKRPGPIALAATVAAQAGMYGYYYSTV
ncbi:uncharacterized protein JCM15063_005569 [Sporobolomyces koalae]|uniref:uncharacterized protein n=1 Tax=Sporobolomyces koalae TaxID=500713 RepID=UPI00317E94FF